jgi:hypothetical protein
VASAFHDFVGGVLFFGAGFVLALCDVHEFVWGVSSIMARLTAARTCNWETIVP